MMLWRPTWSEYLVIVAVLASLAHAGPWIWTRLRWRVSRRALRRELRAIELQQIARMRERAR